MTCSVNVEADVLEEGCSTDELKSVFLKTLQQKNIKMELAEHWRGPVGKELSDLD